ncbi:hypothetical protein M3Y98_01120400 [Aphelenchoides besseyi]|nr:hypothetical protein M3Y98_01120400 [Aphelenchoides besseyi]
MDDPNLQLEGTGNEEESPSPGPQKNMSDKIPSAHSDLIISMILARADQLFADNRKRKPIYNARRKENWKQLVDQLNTQLNCEYSVERVKNNYHYRVTSLKRNISKQLNEMDENVDLNEIPAYQQLSEIDRLLFDAVRSSSTEIAKPMVRRKRGNQLVAINYNHTSLTARPEKLSSNNEIQLDTNVDESSRLFAELSSSAAVASSSTIGGTLDALLADYSRLPVVEQALEISGTSENGDLKQLSVRIFMKEQTIVQSKVIEMMASTVDLVRESAANLERTSAPQQCPTCAGSLMESLLQLYTTNPKAFTEFAQNPELHET